ELMKKAQSGLLKLRLTIAQSAALFGEPVLGKDILNLAMRESKGSQQTCVRQLAELTMPVGDPRQACDLLATQFGELSKPFEAARNPRFSRRRDRARVPRGPAARTRSAVPHPTRSGGSGNPPARCGGERVRRPAPADPSKPWRRRAGRHPRRAPPDGERSHAD